MKKKLDKATLVKKEEKTDLKEKAKKIIEDDFL